MMMRFVLTLLSLSAVFATGTDENEFPGFEAAGEAIAAIEASVEAEVEDNSAFEHKRLDNTDGSDSEVTKAPTKAPTTAAPTTAAPTTAAPTTAAAQVKTAAQEVDSTPAADDGVVVDTEASVPASSCNVCDLCDKEITELILGYDGPSDHWYRVVKFTKQKVTTVDKNGNQRRKTVTVPKLFKQGRTEDFIKLAGDMGKKLVVCTFEEQPTGSSSKNDNLCKGASAMADIRTDCKENLHAQQIALKKRDESTYGVLTVLAGCSENGGGLLPEGATCDKSDNERQGSAADNAAIYRPSNVPSYPSSNYNPYNSGYDVIQSTCSAWDCGYDGINRAALKQNRPCGMTGYNQEADEATDNPDMEGGRTYQIPTLAPCSQQLCCIPKGRCNPTRCGEYAHPIADYDHVCDGPECEFEECCASNDVCSSSVCPSGFRVKNKGRLCKGAEVDYSSMETATLEYMFNSRSLGSCTVEECCIRAPQCGDRYCPAGLMQIQPSSYQCEGYDCELEDCCAPIPHCKPEGCPPGFRPSERVGEPCGYLRNTANPYKYGGDQENGGIQTDEEMAEADTLLAEHGVPAACTLEECCVAEHFCGDYECGHDAVRIVDPSFQLDHPWKFESCCAPLYRCKPENCPPEFAPVNSGNICIGARYNEPNPFDYGYESGGLNNGEYSESGVLNLYYGRSNNYRIPQHCVLEECCRPKDRCGDYQCPPDHLPILPPGHISQTGKYDVHECCAPIPRCTGHCDHGYVPVNVGMACGSHKAPNPARYGAGYETADGTEMEAGAIETEDTEGVVFYGRPAPCLYEECCEKLPMCGDQGCGFDAVRIAPLDHICQGFSCQFEECCAPLHRCGEAECPKGTVPNEHNYGMVCGPTYGTNFNLGYGAPKSPDHRYEMSETESGDLESEYGAMGIIAGFVRPEQCTVDDCCIPLPRCGDYECPRGSFMHVPPEQTCSSPVYDHRQCCAPLPTCDGSECGYGTRPADHSFGKVCDGFMYGAYGGVYEHTAADSEHTAADSSGSAAATPADGIEMENGALEVSTVDTEGGHTGSEFYWLPARPGCHQEECCTHQGECGHFDCGYGAAQINPPEHLCHSLECRKEECCHPVDEFGRFVDFGRYVMAKDDHFCEQLGCDDVHSPQECEYASHMLDLPDNSVSAASSSENPRGCYFRINFQTLWFNEHGTSPSQPSRSNICYCFNGGYGSPNYQDSGVLDSSVQV